MIELLYIAGGILVLCLVIELVCLAYMFIRHCMDDDYPDKD